MRNAIWTRLAAVGLLGGGLVAQTSLWELEGSYAAGFGFEVVGLGDVSGDGVPDVAVAQAVVDQVLVRDGLDGSFLYNVGGQAGSRFGTAVQALGDVNADGTPDFGVSAPDADYPGLGLTDAGQFRVISGLDGATLAVHKPFGSSQVFGGRALDDIDLDGFADYLVETRVPGQSGNDRVRVISGATGVELQAVGPFAVMASGGDLDGDGVGDVVLRVSETDADLQAFSGASLVAGATPQVLWSTTLLDVNGFFPSLRMAFVSDRDGDGRDDLLFSDGFGRLRSLDGTGSSSEVLLDVGVSVLGEQFGFDLVSLGDVDGDAVGDVAVTAAFDWPGDLGFGYAFVASGADGRQLFSGVDPGVAFAGGVGDLDGDLRADVLMAFREAPARAVLRAVSSQQGTLSVVGEPCGSPEPLRLDVFGEATAGGRLALVARGEKLPGQDYSASVLLVGLPSAPTLLPSGCAVHVAPVLALAPFPLVPATTVDIATALLELPVTATGVSLAVQLAGSKTGSGVLVSAGTLLEIP